MFYVALLCVSCVLFALALLGFLAEGRLRRRIQAMHKEIASLSNSRPKTVSALGDSLDALQVVVRGIDTKLETVYSLSRSNRTRITNLQHRGDGAEPGPDSAPDPALPPSVLRLPGRAD